MQLDWNHVPSFALHPHCFHFCERQDKALRTACRPASSALTCKCPPACWPPPVSKVPNECCSACLRLLPASPPPPGLLSPVVGAPFSGMRSKAPSTRCPPVLLYLVFLVSSSSSQPPYILLITVSLHPTRLSASWVQRLSPGWFTAVSLLPQTVLITQ